MKKNFIHYSILSFVIVFSGLLIGSCSADYDTDYATSNEYESTLKKGDASQSQLLAQVRRATAKYQRLEVAEADGYELSEHCVYNEELGGMGHHAVNAGLLGTDFDPLKPQALLYEATPDGKYNLVGVEYIVFNIDQPHPHFGNQLFDVGGTPIPDPHYSLHVWVWKANPNGMYTAYNPNVSCGDMD
jgi:hypothetical protein